MNEFWWEKNFLYFKFFVVYLLIWDKFYHICLLSMLKVSLIDMTTITDPVQDCILHNVNEKINDGKLNFEVPPWQVMFIFFFFSSSSFSILFSSNKIMSNLHYYCKMLWGCIWTLLESYGSGLNVSKIKLCQI